MDDISFEEYNQSKAKLEKIYGNIGEGIKIRSIRMAKNVLNFFVNLEKRNDSNSTIKKLFSENEEVAEPKMICKQIATLKLCLRKLFLKKILISTTSYILYHCQRSTVTALIIVKRNP